MLSRLGLCKGWVPPFRSILLFNNSRRKKCLTSFLDIPLCNFGTGYGCEHISLTFNYNSKYNGFFFCVTSVPLNNYLIFCKNPSRYFCWSSVKCWHCYFITLFKYDLLYLDYNILNNHLLEVRKSFDSNTYSTYESVRYSSEVA